MCVQLIRLGLLDNLEEALDSPDGTVRMCAAYVVSRLVRNTQVSTGPMPLTSPGLTLMQALVARTKYPLVIRCMRIMMILNNTSGR